MQNLDSRGQAEFIDRAAAIRAARARRAKQGGARENQRGLWTAPLPVGAGINIKISVPNWLAEGKIWRETRAIGIQAEDCACAMLARVKRCAEQQIAGQSEAGIRISSVAVVVIGSECESVQGLEPLRGRPANRYQGQTGDQRGQKGQIFDVNLHGKIF